MNLNTKETDQIRTLIRQIAEAKTNEYMQAMFVEITGTNGAMTVTPTRKTRRKVARKATKTTTSTATEKTVDGANRVLKFIKAKPEGITGMELKPAVDLPQWAYARAIKVLKQEGKIKQKGSKRGTTYFAVTPKE